MSKPPRIITLTESKTGRNLTFQDTKTKETLTRAALVSKIEKGEYPDYDVRNIGGIKTPVSKPDGNEDNNLG